MGDKERRRRFTQNLGERASIGFGVSFDFREKKEERKCKTA